jgi:hypothetical protein
VDPRRLAVAIACSLVIAGAVVVLALGQRSPAPKETPTACAKPFAGKPPLSFELPARYRSSGKGAMAHLRSLGDPRTDPQLALALTAAEYNANQIQAARRSLLQASAVLGNDDTRVAVATAMVRWTPESSDEVERTLEGIAADTPTGRGCRSSSAASSRSGAAVRRTPRTGSRRRRQRRRTASTGCWPTTSCT